MSRIISDLPSVPVTLRVAGVRLRNPRADNQLPVRVEFAVYHLSGVEISFKEIFIGDSDTRYPVHVALEQRLLRRPCDDGERTNNDIIATLTHYYNEATKGQTFHLYPYLSDNNFKCWYLNCSRECGDAKLLVDNHYPVVDWTELYPKRSGERMFVRRILAEVKKERAARRKFEAACARHTNLCDPLPDWMM